LTGGGSSIPEVQRLLRVLAAGRRCAETGTAFGEGAAAIASVAESLVTVERDAERAAIAANRLATFGNVELLVGDWREHLPGRAPFDFLFFDAGKFDEAADAIELVAPGGLLLKDDLTPGRPGPDPVRELLFDHPELIAVEVLTTPQTAAIVATRRRPWLPSTSPRAPS
jgi:predicted O-methyltransferase YrrM